jgi:two-component system sensor histidine kinase SenX3
VSGAAPGGDSRLEEVLEGLVTAVVLVDGTGTVLFQNEPARRLLSDGPRSAVPRTSVAAAAARVRSAGAAVEEDLDVFGPPRRFLRLRAQPLRDGVVVELVDATATHQLNQVRRDFVANVSHELKTPIGALTVLADAVLGEADPAVTRRLVERIRDETDRLGRLVVDLLDLSKIEVGGSPILDAVDLSQVAGEAIARVAPAAEAKQVSIRATVPAVVVRGDLSQLVSAVANLLDNAIAYSDAGSKVDIEAALTSGGGVELAVSDSGMGIPADEHERIFERFYRVDRARSRATGGTGLGLAIVRHVAQNHAADVSVDSEPGRGSRFAIRFPAAAVAPS